MSHRSLAPWSVLLVIAALGLGAVGCGDDDAVTPDAGPGDAGPPDPPPSTDHCTYVEMPANARAGGTVSAGTLSAGAAERRITVPLGATLGAYTGRSERFGGDGFIDGRHTTLGGTFAPSVGVETWPRVRAVALTTGAYDETRPAGDETIVILTADLGAAYQGLTHEVEARLGPDFSGKVIFATSHSHSSFANFTGHSALQLGFGQFQRTAFDAILEDLEAAARAALEARRPARIGIAHDGSFDPEDRVTRDRRGEDDDLQGGRRDDHDLFVIRVDGTDGEPIAILPVFGMHGTSLGADNVLVSGDAPGGIQRVLEDEFDGEVVVAHLQGAGADVSPVGLEGATRCPEGAEYCHDYARLESIGWNAREAILATWAAAGESMVDSVELEMVTRSVDRGPRHENFRVRDGELEYAPFDLRRVCDAEVWEDPDTRTTLISPIDEFNAPYGAALCGESPLVFGRAQMPGTNADVLDDTSYPTCLMIQSVDNIIEAAFEIELDEPPICDTTRTTVSAARIGDFVLVTLPGEPATLLVDRLRMLVEEETGVPPERTIAIGYAQDHGGYMLTAEDWLRGGYEPTITFWGPLEGEAIMEQAVRLVPLVLTPERDDGAAGGTTRVAVPLMDDRITSDPAPMAGTVPASAPTRLTTRLGTIPAPQPTDVARLESAYFTWIGADPLEGTPVVVLERETSPGTFEVVRRRSGRPVSDGAMLLTWTPDPLEDVDGPQTHYYTVEWQALGWGEDREGASPLAGRLGAPAGTYRFHVYGPETEGGPLYELTSDPFEVTPATLQATLSDGTLAVTAHAPTGYRLLDLTAGATNPVPLRGAAVEIAFDGGSPTSITLDSEGRASVTAPSGWANATLADSFGNTATLAR